MSDKKVARLQDQPLDPKPLDLSMQELYKVLLQSEKFRNWQKPTGKLRAKDLDPALSAEEKHLTPQDLAEAWGVSVETIRSIFRTEPGVLKLGKTGARHRRLAA
jgi:hypothetical protein